MTDSFRIRFGEDVPLLAVEAVAKGRGSIATTMSKPGTRWEVSAQKEDTFLNMTLPSGRRVTLAASELTNGKLTRQDLGLPTRADPTDGIGLSGQTKFTGLKDVDDIDVQSLERGLTAPQRMTELIELQLERLGAAGERLAEGIVAAMPLQGLVQQGFAAREVQATESFRFAAALEDLTHGSWPFVLNQFHSLPALQLKQLLYGNPVENELAVTVTQNSNPDLENLVPIDPHDACELIVSIRQHRLEVRLPGSAVIRVERVARTGDSLVRVEVHTDSPVADTVGAYLARSDLHAAITMDEWVNDDSSFAAVVEGYRLLRLGRFDKMDALVVHLATEFPNLPDSHVIRATQLLRRGASDEHSKEDAAVNEAADLYCEAADMGWPIFTDGARLLVGALLRLGDDGRERLAKLEKDDGELLAASPFTAKVFRERQGDDIRFDDIRFEVVYRPVL